jgi:hypothetical protein
MPFGFHLAMDTLPSGVPREDGSRSALAVSGFRLRARLGFSIPVFSLRPARHYPRFRIWRPSSERQRDFNPPEQRAAQRTLRPLLTSRSVFPRRPFSHEARYPRVRTHSFTAQPPDLRRLALITRASRNFARSPCSATPSMPKALRGAGSPVLVHRLAASLHASSPHSVTLMQLRFASFAVINLRWDFHPQECARAGRTRKKPALRRLFYVVRRAGPFRRRPASACDSG